MKRWQRSLFVFLSIFMVFSIVSERVSAANIPTYPKYTDNKDTYYFVANMYYEVWKGTGGEDDWRGGVRPGDRIRKDYDYTFDFEGRKVLSITAHTFDATQSVDVDGTQVSQQDVFFYSRYEKFYWEDFKRTSSTDYISTKRSESGINTSSVSITVNADGRLNAARPDNPALGGDFANGVRAERHYFPTLITIKLAPLAGKAVIKHFTTNGQSLNGVSGFTDSTKDLRVGTNYSFTHTPGTAEYVYKGFKKSTVSAPTGGSVEGGDPPALNPYDGSFPFYYVYYYYEGEMTIDPPPSTGGCTVPAPGQRMTGKFLDPVVTAKIQADSRGNEAFDVLQGIPTSESLYGNVLARSFLYQDEFVQMTGKCTFNVSVKKDYTLTWDPGKPGQDAQGRPITLPDPKREVESKTYEYQIERPYSFWTIENLEVYKIDQATLANYALPNSSILIRPNGYTAPYYAASTNGKFYPPTPPSTVQASGQSLSGGKNKPSVPNEQSSLQGEAEKVVEKVKVENDSLQFNGQTIMDNQRVNESGPTPGQIPEPQHIGPNVLYSPNHLIPIIKTNKANQPSSGSIYYSQMSGSTKLNYPIYGINAITVHTPTVMYANASDDTAHNQKTTPNIHRRAVILDRPFQISMPTSGQHKPIPGYGHRDYAKYMMVKQVCFEFDVYTANRSVLYPKNTWINIPIHELESTFFLPVWVDEGDYTVYFRSFAENSPSLGFTTQPEANLNLDHHVATDTVPVEVIGRLYDFRITDIADPIWETVFRTSKGSPTPKGTSYWVGTQGIDGHVNQSVSPYVLPIRRGSHPISSFKTMSIKTGYHFKFDVKTKGNMFNTKDAIRITPTFYFQDNHASTPPKRVEVDLYYHSNTTKFVKIGSSKDIDRRNIILNTRLRNVPPADIANTAGALYDMKTNPTTSRTEYITTFQKRALEPTYVGGYGFEILPSPLRTFINTLDRPAHASASAAQTKASIQQWYGEYSLPAAVYVVAEGTDLATYGRKNRLDEASPIFLRNGYITVNFNIETIRDADLQHPHLQYIHAPLLNQWWDMENYDGWDGVRDRMITDPYGVQYILQDGDVVLYDANKSSYDDYDVRGTH
ncbi:DUF5704 domain-containing protein [Paenibacillus sp. CMAA1364]